MSFSNNRKLTVGEIQAVKAILDDKELIDTLKQIQDKTLSGDDAKEKLKQWRQARKDDDGDPEDGISPFIGFAREEDVIGGGGEGGDDKGEESEELQTKKSLVRKLVDMGLIDEGAHIPLVRTGKEKRSLSAAGKSSDAKRIRKFRLTEEGFAVLAARLAIAKSGGNSTKSTATTENHNKGKAVESFKHGIRKEDSR